jgi:hypothetical protein
MKNFQACLQIQKNAKILNLIVTNVKQISEDMFHPKTFSLTYMTLLRASSERNF